MLARPAETGGRRTALGLVQNSSSRPTLQPVMPLPTIREAQGLAKQRHRADRRVRAEREAEAQAADRREHFEPAVHRRLQRRPGEEVVVALIEAQIAQREFGVVGDAREGGEPVSPCTTSPSSASRAASRNGPGGRPATAPPADRRPALPRRKAPCRRPAHGACPLRRGWPEPAAHSSGRTPPVRSPKRKRAGSRSRSSAIRVIWFTMRWASWARPVIS